MDIDSQTNTILVVDKRARIQRLASDGTPLQEWSTTRKNGNPTGIFVDDDGTIFVVDTQNIGFWCTNPMVNLEPPSAITARNLRIHLSHRHRSG